MAARERILLELPQRVVRCSIGAKFAAISMSGKSFRRDFALRNNRRPQALENYFVRDSGFRPQSVIGTERNSSAHHDSEHGT